MASDKLQGLRKAEEVNFNSNFSFFASLSAAEAQVFGVTVSNNFTKRRQNGLKSAQETSSRHI